MRLTGEELLAGSALTYEVEIPAAVLSPGNEAGQAENGPKTVTLKPLRVDDLQLIARAAKENDAMVAALMVQKSMVEPRLSIAEVAAMHVGLMSFLLDQVNAISGISASTELLAREAEAPLAKAAFILAREFGWTPAQVSELTMGQILLHLQMLKEQQVHSG